MILYLDTSTPIAKIWLDDISFEHETNRNLARDLLSIILKDIEATTHESTPTLSSASGKSLQDSDAKGSPENRRLETLHRITAIAILRGPGSFTGLRIGATVANALSAQLNIPIAGATGENWRTTAKTRLQSGANDQLILPLYSHPANITTPTNQ